MPPIVTPSQIVGRLNFLSEDFLLRYAFHYAPSPDSKTAEWCRALERDVEALMQVLGVPDQGYPERRMNLDARIGLTNIGGGFALNKLQYQSMRLGDDAWQVLDRVPAALWAKEMSAGQRDPSKNARQPQNAYLLQGMVLLFEICFGLSFPPDRPNHNGPFVQAIDFVRLRLVERIEGGPDFTDQGSDKSAARRLHSFTPIAIAHLWAREGQRLMAGLAEYRSIMTRGVDQSVPE